MKLIDLAVKELDCWPGGQWLVQNPNDGQWRAFNRNLPQLRLTSARNKEYTWCKQYGFCSFGEFSEIAEDAFTYIVTEAEFKKAKASVKIFSDGAVIMFDDIMTAGELKYNLVRKKISNMGFDIDLDMGLFSEGRFYRGGVILNKPTGLSWDSPEGIERHLTDPSAKVWTVEEILSLPEKKIEDTGVPLETLVNTVKGLRGSIIADTARLKEIEAKLLQKYSIVVK